jgi:hypothetical protein
MASPARNPIPMLSEPADARTTIRSGGAQLALRTAAYGQAARHRPRRTKGEEFMRRLSKRSLLAATILALAVFAALMVSEAFAGAKDAPGAAKGLGQLSGLLPRDHLTTESAIQVDLSSETVRLPLYKGEANGQTVWYVLLDASDPGWHTTWASTTRLSSPTSASAAPSACRR